MRGQKLRDLRLMLKAECSDSLDVGTALDGELNQLLATKQEFLASQYDWAQLETYADIAVPVGGAGRYNNLPALNFNRPVKVEVKFNEKWQPVEYGISSVQYNYIDSDQNEPLDPIQRWQMRPVTDSAVAPTFEIWPLPATPQTLRMWGQQELLPFGEDDDEVCTLDGLMLVLYCAAERLAKLEQQNAQAKLAAANQLAATLKSIDPRERLTFGLNKQQDNRKARRLVPIVLVHG